MATTLDWVKSLRAHILGDYVKGWDLRRREVGVKNGYANKQARLKRQNYSPNYIGWRKTIKSNILNTIVEIKYLMYHNDDSLKVAYKKFFDKIKYQF